VSPTKFQDPDARGIRFAEIVEFQEEEIIDGENGKSQMFVHHVGWAHAFSSVT
jgi:hypothetical protein